MTAIQEATDDMKVFIPYSEHRARQLSSEGDSGTPRLVPFQLDYACIRTTDSDTSGMKVTQDGDNTEGRAASPPSSG